MIFTGITLHCTAIDLLDEDAEEAEAKKPKDGQKEDVDAGENGDEKDPRNQHMEDAFFFFFFF